jgi:hypothetical protein
MLSLTIASPPAGNALVSHVFASVSQLLILFHNYRIGFVFEKTVTLSISKLFWVLIKL